MKKDQLIVIKREIDFIIILFEFELKAFNSFYYNLSVLFIKILIYP